MAVVRFTPNGVIDPTFDGDGLATVAVRSGVFEEDTAYGIATQADGKIVIVGYSRNSGLMLARFTTSGSLDPTFGNGGIVTTLIAGPDRGSDLEIMADGRIIVCAQAVNSFSVARFLTNGALDPSFNGTGKVNTEIIQSSYSNPKLSLQSDGKLVVAGGTTVVRYLLNGLLDMSFGIDGKRTITLGDYSTQIADIAIDQDGRIAIAGLAVSNNAYRFDFAITRLSSSALAAPTGLNASDGTYPDKVRLTWNPVPGAQGYVVLRSSTNLSSTAVDFPSVSTTQFDDTTATVGAPYYYWVRAWSAQESVSPFSAGDSGSVLVDYGGLNDGTINSNFGIGGVVTTNFATGDSASGLANDGLLQPDGKIILMGQVVVNGSSRVGLARYLPDGSLDTSFGNGGLVAEEIGNLALTGVLQPDGKIVVVSDTRLLRYHSNGLLDASFGINGSASLTGISPFEQHCLALLPDGKLLVGGYTSDGTRNVFALARVNSDGSMDTTFDGDGLVTTPIGTGHSLAWGLTVQSDGKILLCGNTSTSLANGATGRNFAVARYLPSGALDTSFATNGIKVMALGAYASNYMEYARQVLVQPDGKIILSGKAGLAGAASTAVVRLLANGALDTTFDGDGIFTTSIANSGGGCALQSDGKILVGGAPSGALLTGPFSLIRLNSNGSLDTTFDGDGMVDITFNATQGNFASMLVLPDDRVLAIGSKFGNNHHEFAMSMLGHALAPEISVAFNGREIVSGDTTPSTLDGTAFGAVGVGSSLTREFQLRNIGSTSLSVSSVTVSAAPFRIVDGFTGSTPAGESRTFRLAYEPGAAGTHTATVTIQSSDTSEATTTFSVSGSSTAGDDFGDTLAQATTITVNNDTVNGRLDFATDADWFRLEVTDRGVLSAWSTGTTDTLGAFFDASGTMIGTESDNHDGVNFHVFASVTPGVYYLRVRSQGAIGPYTVATHFDRTTLDAPASISASDGVFASKVQVTWPAVPGAERYYVRRSYYPYPYLGQDRPYTTSTTLDDNPGQLERPFYYWVRSWSASTGYSAFSPMDDGMMAFPTFGEGTLDRTFASNGLATWSYSTDAVGKAVAAQSDGKMLVAGRVLNGSYYDFGVARFLSNGSLDTTFGTSGYVLTDFAGGSDYAAAMRIQPDGKILVAGYAVDGSVAKFALARYLTNGTLDTSFGTAGKVLTRFTYNSADNINGITLQPDGKIVAVGTSAVGSENAVALARYNSDGTLDLNFGISGMARVVQAGVQGAIDVVVFSGGRIAVVCGSSGQAVVLGFLPDGSLDTGFGTSGRVSIDSAFGTSIAMADDGKLVVGASSNGQLLATRLNTDGSLDTSFGTSGKSITNFPQTTGNSYIAIQGDGKIVLTGNGGGYPNGISMARMNADGTLDASFGSAGLMTKVFPPDQSVPESITIGADGNIYTGGWTQNTTTNQRSFALTRFVSAPIPPEINVLYNSTPILAGDATPSVTDGTDFERLSQGLTLARTFTIVNRGSSPLTLSGISTDAPQFRLSGLPSSPLAPGASASFTLNYEPVAPGTNTGTVTILSNDSNESPYTFAISGSSNGVLPTPTGVSASDGLYVGKVRVTWPNVAGAERYQVFRSTTNSFTTAKAFPTQTAPPLTDTSTLVGTTYYYWVQAWSADKGYSAVSSADAGYAVNPSSTDGLDATFGIGGKITLTVPGLPYVEGANGVLQPDGKLLIVGSGSPNAHSVGFLIVVRLNSDGTFDPTFGTNGVFQFTAFTGSSGSNITLQSDGKVLVCGGARDLGNSAYYPIVCRLTSTGALDATFNGAGYNRRLTGYSSALPWANIKVQSDGKILVAGTDWTQYGRLSLVLGRYNADGTLDNGFGTGGFNQPIWGYNYNDDHRGGRLLLLPDGKILVQSDTQGATWPFLYGRFIEVIKFNANGSLDTTFASSGVLTTGIYGATQGILADQGGNFTVAGWSNVIAAPGFTIARYDFNGGLVSSFFVNEPLTPANQLFTAYQSSSTYLARQADGKLVAAGNYSGTDWSLQRWNPDASMDNTLDGDGRMIIDFNSGTDTVGSILVQPDKKIVMIGSRKSSDGETSQIAIARNTVTEPAGLSLFYGSTSLTAGDTTPSAAEGTDFGTTATGAPVTRVFTIQNTGQAVLGQLSVSIDGPNASSFIVTQPLTSSLSGGTSTTFTVSFNPSLSGTKQATLHIASNAATNDPFNLALSGNGLAPEIVVLDAGTTPNTYLVDGGSTVNLGTVLAGQSITRSFIIQNTGTANLTGLSVTKDGANSGDITITQPVLNTLTSSASTTFSIQFSPAANGTRVANIHIASNDADENPFNISLTGSGLTAQENWRRTYFGATSNTGNAADTSMPDRDGVPNLLKYALVITPGTPSAGALPQGLLRSYFDGDRLAMIFSRDPARNDITLEVQVAGDLAGPWTIIAMSAGGAAFTGQGAVGETNAGSLKTVEVRDSVNIGDAPRRFMRVRVAH